MRAINRKIALITIIAIIILAITFYGQYTSQLKEIQNTAESKEALINRYIDLSKGFIDLVAIYSNDYFQHGVINDSMLYSQIKYNNQSNTYNLDVVGGSKDQMTAGNLTGIGEIPQNGIYRNEVNLALKLNEQFSSIYNKIPDIAWVYYTSENNFINIYPWISSDDFSFNEDLKAEKFYTYVTPENDPLCQSVWTPVYLDHAGKGLMVTLSSPIYCAGTFMGAVSLDITNKLLDEMIKSEYEIYLIDDTDSVLANSVNIKLQNDVPKLNTLLNTSTDNVEDIKKTQNGTLQRNGNYYIYSTALNDAPWRMIMRVPVMLIIGNAALSTLPVLFSCILLLFMVFEVEKRRKTEEKLRTSLDEITSFHKLLDNAARYDFLTSTVNRRGLEDIFTKNADRETNIPIEIIMGDIDYFKNINDTYGHAAGDRVLIELATTMKESVSEKDVVCRWGGEEFVIVLMNRTYEEAMLFAEKLRKEIDAKVIPWDNSVDIRATITFGVAEHNPDDTIEKSITKADNALYAGKKRGRNQVVGYLDIRK